VTWKSEADETATPKAAGKAVSMNMPPSEMSSDTPGTFSHESRDVNSTGTSIGTRWERRCSARLNIDALRSLRSSGRGSMWAPRFRCGQIRDGGEPPLEARLA
jgi:hypothetical protein